MKKILSFALTLAMAASFLMSGAVTASGESAQTQNGTSAAAVDEGSSLRSDVSYPTTDGKWISEQTQNLVITPAIPTELSTDSGADVEGWQSNWDTVMIPGGWDSLYVTGADNALQVYSTTALDGSSTFAIRPTTMGTTGTNANLGGAGSESVFDGGISYTVKLSAEDIARANAGAVSAVVYAEF